MTPADFFAVRDRVTRLFAWSPMWGRAAPLVLREFGNDRARFEAASDLAVAFAMGKVAGRVEGARRAGSVRSPAKALASRANGLRGGRPRERAPAPRRR